MYVYFARFGILAVKQKYREVRFFPALSKTWQKGSYEEIYRSNFFGIEQDLWVDFQDVSKMQCFFSSSSISYSSSCSSSSVRLLPYLPVLPFLPLCPFLPFLLWPVNQNLFFRRFQILINTSLQPS